MILSPAFAEYKIDMLVLTPASKRHPDFSIPSGFSRG